MATPDIAKIVERIESRGKFYLERETSVRIAAIDQLVALVKSTLHKQATTAERIGMLEQAHGILVAQTNVDLANEFIGCLPEIQEEIEIDIEAAFSGDPSVTSRDEIVESFPSIHALTHHRLAHFLYQANERRLARLVSEVAHSATGIDIHPGAKIGHGFFIDHGTGVVIGETAIIGNNVRIYQGVTLGAKSFRKDSDGKIIKGDPRHPMVEDDVVIYAHATILGRIRIGKGSIIGGNVWVTSDVPAGTRVLQTNANREVFRGYGEGI